jgi:predicted dehydrogenase
VWTEKPAADSVGGIQQLQRARADADRVVLVGLKKIFTPAIEKTEQIIAAPEFGPISSIYVRYPQSLPHPDDRRLFSWPRKRQANGAAATMLPFLDHIYHPAALLHHLGGPIDRFSYEWEPTTGSTVTNLRFRSGAVGSLHLAAGIAASSPLERLEVVGRDANVVIDNGVRVTYYRPGGARTNYGRDASYIGDDHNAPLFWEPQFSLGTLSNKNLFYLGYVQEILHFCESVLFGRPPVKGTLEDALAVMQIFEGYQRTPAGTPVSLPVDQDGEEDE